MSDNINETYKGVPLKKYEGKISDLGYKSGEELIENALKKFDAARALIETHRLRLMAKTIGINKIDAHTEAFVLQFQPDAPIDAVRIIELIQQNRHIRFNGPEKLRITAKMPDLTSRTSQIKATIRLLNPQQSTGLQKTPSKKSANKKKAGKN